MISGLGGCKIASGPDVRELGAASPSSPQSDGGERAGAEPVITGEAVTGGIELADQAGEAADEFGGPAGLIVLAGSGDAEGQAGEVG